MHWFDVPDLIFSCLTSLAHLQVQVRFARPESEQARQRRIQSYEFLQKKQAEEPWVHLHYHGVKVGVHLLMRHIQCCLYCNCLSLWCYHEEFLSFVFVMFKYRTVAQSMKGSTYSVSQWTPQRILNWSKLLSEYEHMTFSSVLLLLLWLFLLFHIFLWFY